MVENALTKDVEAKLLDLGACKTNIFKWRRRGVPAAWRLKLLEAESRSSFGPQGEVDGASGAASPASPFPTEADA
jgi:hypothetical protein